MGLGTIYRHDYDNVADVIVWRTVHQSLPSLLALAEAEIACMSHHDPAARS